MVEELKHIEGLKVVGSGEYKWSIPEEIDPERHKISPSTRLLSEMNGLHCDEYLGHCMHVLDKGPLLGEDYITFSFAGNDSESLIKALSKNLQDYFKGKKHVSWRMEPKIVWFKKNELENNGGFELKIMTRVVAV